MLIITLGLCASAAVIFLSLAIQRKQVIIATALVSVFTLAQYALLGKGTAVALTAITLAYALIIPLEKRYPWLLTRWTPYALGLIYTAAFLAMNGLSLGFDVLAYLASISGTVLMAVKSPLVAKYLMLSNGLAWAVYQAGTGAYGQLPGEAFFLAGTLISLFLIYKQKRKGGALSEVPEVTTLIRRSLVRTREKKAGERDVVPTGAQRL